MAARTASSEIAVVFLAYLPYGCEQIDRFFDSYEQHNAECEHELVLVEKGSGPHPPRLKHPAFFAPTYCLDLGTYLWVARKHSAKRFCFLNTSSVILCDGWLEKLNRHLEDGVGMVGATGSFGNSDRSRQPNPHVRTNAFLMDRDLLLDLDWQEPIETKERAFAVEHGPKSLTNQVRERGLKALVAGRDGRAYDLTQWRDSMTFWNGEQENLLVADNATRRWTENENGRHRRVLWRFAWKAA